ncbi:transposase [Streptomyces sp. NPDC004682]
MDRAVVAGPDAERGGRWRDHRQAIGAIAFQHRTRTPWTGLPERFGSWGVRGHLRKKAADDAWERVFTVLLGQADAGGDLVRLRVSRLVDRPESDGGPPLSVAASTVRS